LCFDFEKPITVNQTFAVIFRFTFNLLKYEADYQLYLIGRAESEVKNGGSSWKELLLVSNNCR